MKWSYVWGNILVLCLLIIPIYADTMSNVPMVQVPQVSVPAVQVQSADSAQPADTKSPKNTDETGPVTEAINFISMGDTVFIGEEHLDIHATLADAQAIAWWACDNCTPRAIQPDAVIEIPDKHNFFVDPAFFVGKTGNWYQWKNSTAGLLAMKIKDPSIRIVVWDATTDEAVTGKYIQTGHFGNFVIESDMYQIMNRYGVQQADGPMKIMVTSPSNETYQALIGSNYAERSLTHLAVNAPLWYWTGVGDDHTRYPPQDGWNTSVINPFTGSRVYKPGIYTIRAECNANGMKNTYKAPDGSDYVNKTVTPLCTVLLADNEVRITVDKTPVSQGQSFTTTITGLPYESYYLWAKDTANMTGLPGDQPPLLSEAQEGIYMDAVAGPYEIGSYVPSDTGGKTIRQDVATGDPWIGTRFYGLVKLNETGSRTISWDTTNDSAINSFTIAVEAKTDVGYTNDSGLVTITGGNAVSITPLAIRPYYPEELIILSGTNQASDTTYLFMNGQNLPGAGGSLTQPDIPALTDQPATFTTADVADNNTWQYLWKIPQNITVNGLYTLYAAAGPKNLTDINQTGYASEPITILPTSEGENITLIPGWNFVSTPGVLKNGSDTMAIFSQVNSSGHSVLSYNGQSGSWITLKANDSFVPLNGIWIYTVSPCQVPLVFENGVMVPPRTLVQGWNTLGIASPDRPVSQALQSIQSLWSYLVRYDPVTQRYHDPIINGNLTDNTTLRVKEGFWIYMRENGTFTG